MFRRFRGFFTKSNIQKENYNKQKSCSDLCVVSKIYKIHSSSSSSIFAVANKQTIPKMISFVKVKNTKIEDKSTKFGVIKAKANQPAERLPKRLEYALSHGLVKSLSIRFTLPNILTLYKNCDRIDTTEVQTLYLGKLI